MSASLNPVSGSTAGLLSVLRPWVEDGGPGLVIRTSGSTGEPKDVILSHAAMIASATATHERLGGPGQWLLALPATGVAGLQVLIRSILAGQEPLDLADHRDLPEAIAAMTGPRQYASLVPTQLHRLATANTLPVLAGLDALLIGGASVSPVLLAQARRAGVNVVRTYGMSETCGGCVYDGRPLEGVRVRVDEDRQIHLAGPMLFDGYADPEATGRVLRDGWFATDDLGEFDAEGALRVLGRSDDVVISGGVNVSLPALTEVLRDISGVSDAQAIAVDDAEWGQRVIGFLVGDVPIETVRDAVEAAGLPRTWAPRQVIALEELPLLPGGKIDRQELRRLL